MSDEDSPAKRAVFISHSTIDKWIADAICAALENSGVSCWIAPRDITPGVAWAEAIMDGIEETCIMVIVLSEQSNASPQVLREVSQAVHHQNAIIPFRVADVPLSKELRYFFSTQHWLDALTPPLEMHIEKLVKSIFSIIDAHKIKPPSWAQKPAKAAPRGFVPLEGKSEGEVPFDKIFQKNSGKGWKSWLTSFFDDK